MTIRLPVCSSAFGPVSATVVLLAAGPLAIWSLVMFLMLLSGVVDLGLPGVTSYLALLVVSLLGALACRRAINVLRSRQGGAERRSRAARALMLVGIVAVSQVPVTMWANQSMEDTLHGPMLFMLVGGLIAALSGAVVNLLPRAPVDEAKHF